MVWLRPNSWLQEIQDERVQLQVGLPVALEPGSLHPPLPVDAWDADSVAPGGVRARRQKGMHKRGAHALVADECRERLAVTEPLPGPLDRYAAKTAEIRRLLHAVQTPNLDSSFKRI